MQSAPAQDLVSASFVGSSDFINRVAVDRQGAVYWITGNPVIVTGAPIHLLKAGNDYKVIYDIPIGTSGVEFINGLKADENGSAYVLGVTASTEFPLTSTAPWKTHSGAGPAPFLMKVDPQGKISYATYVGPGGGTAIDVATRADGTLALTAMVDSDITTPGGFRGPGCERAGADIVRLDPTRSAPVYVACLGDTLPYAVGIAPGGEVVLAGSTSDATFPVTPGVFQPDIKGGQCIGSPIMGGTYTCPNITVSKLAADGSHLIYSTFLGGTASAIPTALAVDKEGNAYVAGSILTNGQPGDFPILIPGAASSKIAPGRELVPFIPPSQAVLARISPTADKLLYSFKPPIGHIAGVDVTNGNTILIAGGARDDTPKPGAAAAGCGLTVPFPGVIAEVDDSASLQSVAILPSTIPRTVIAHDGLAGVAAVAYASSPVTPDGLVPDADHNLVWQGTYNLHRPSALGCVANGASYTEATPFAPGELITFYGADLGPAALHIAQPDANGVFPAELDGTRVLFDGIPGAVLAVSPTQVNAAVPYSLSGHESTIVDLQVGDRTVASRKLAIRLAVPTVLLGDVRLNQGTFQPGAVRNQDDAVNTDENYAFYKPIVSIFVTGLGHAIPNVVDRSTGASFTPTVPIRVWMNFNEAEVVDVSIPEGTTNSVVRIRARVPDICCGGRLPLQVGVSDVRSPQGPYIVVH